MRIASSPVAILRRKLGAIPGVEEATSRFGAGRQRALPDDERLVPRDSTSDWTECRLIESGDAEYAVELIVQAARCAWDK